MKSNVKITKSNSQFYFQIFYSKNVIYLNMLTTTATSRHDQNNTQQQGKKRKSKKRILFVSPSNRIPIHINKSWQLL